MCKTRTIASKKAIFSLNHQFLCWSPESPLKVSWRFRTLGPLGDLQGTSPGRHVPARLHLIMENEKLSSSGCGDEEVQEMTAISSLFEQAMLLVGQAFHSVTYYCRQNILSILIDNPSKVKETLKDPDMALDNISNTYLFGDKFEKKLLKDTMQSKNRLIIYLGSPQQEIMLSRDALIFVLQNLGFIINFQKSVLNPSHQIQFLSVEIDSLTMIVSPPLQKKEQIISQCQDLLSQSVSH